MSASPAAIPQPAPVIDLSQFKDLFLRTQHEHIGVIRNSLLMVRLNPEDTASLEKMHISAHSMKGQNLAMGYKNSALYCRVLEYIFRDAMAKKKPLAPELIGMVKDALVKIEESLAAVEEKNQEVDLSKAAEALAKSAGIKLTDVK